MLDSNEWNLDWVTSAGTGTNDRLASCLSESDERVPTARSPDQRQPTPAKPRNNNSATGRTTLGLRVGGRMGFGGLSVSEIGRSYPRINGAKGVLNGVSPDSDR